MKTIRLPLSLLAAAFMLTGIAQARLVDGFDDAAFETANWTKNVIQAGNPNDTITFDQTTTPGKLTITYVDEQGSDQTTHYTRPDIQLSRVGDYVEAQVRLAAISGSPVVNLIGVGLLWTDAVGSIDRSNSTYIALRGDGIIKQNGYGNGGAEIGDRDTPVAGFSTATVLTVRLVRSAENVITAYYGIDAPATLPEGGWSIDYSAQSNLPVYPGIYLAAGIGSYTAEVENFRVGNTLDLPDDNFDDEVLSLNFDPNNHPQYGGNVDQLTFTEAGGRLHLDYVNNGSDQITFIMRDDLALEDGDSVVASVQIEEGEATPNIGFGIALATTGNGLNQNRANTVYYVLRNDGLARANFFGNGGAEIGDPFAAISGYQVGDWVTLRIYRTGQILQLYYGVGFEAEATQLVGQMDYTSHVLPTVPGLMTSNGLVNFKANAEYLLVGPGRVPVELSTFTLE